MDTTNDLKNGDDNMAILAVPSKNALVVSEEQGRKILNEIENSKPLKKNKELTRQTEALRRKPDKQ